MVHHADNDFAPVAYLEFKKLDLQDKNPEEIHQDDEVMKRLIESKKISSLRNDADYLSTFDPLPISALLNLPASKSHSAPYLFALTDSFLTTKYLSTSDFPSDLETLSIVEAQDTDQLSNLLDFLSSLL